MSKLDDIFSCNDGLDIAIPLTDDVVATGDEPYRETLIIWQEGYYHWFIRGEQLNDLTDWQIDDPDDAVFTKLSDALQAALKFIQSHENAAKWADGVEIIRRLIDDPTLDPRPIKYEPYPGPNSWCPTHHCQFELIYRDPPGYEFYECPECERERGGALGLI